ncbi:MAG: hypothetical protein AB7S26_40260 [Sandaracinaceae bacterium]
MSSTRERLIAAQLELARALTDDDAPTPSGFDGDALEHAREVLHRKKARCARRCTDSAVEHPLRRLARLFTR